MHREWPDASDILGETDFPGSPDNGDTVKFTLSYEGPLPSCTTREKRKSEKQALRAEFSYQLAQVWGTEPGLSSRLKHFDKFDEAEFDPSTNRLYRKGALRKKPARYGVTYELGGFCFVPLVTAQGNLWCELDLTLYRNGDPGHVISRHGADLDSHMKLLLDALRMPHTRDELAGATPADTGPFFCLLEDDRLVTRLSIDTRRWIRRTDQKKSDREVHVTIAVTVVARKVTEFNRDLLT